MAPEADSTVQGHSGDELDLASDEYFYDWDGTTDAEANPGQTGNEKKEYRRHRTMIWELTADFLLGGKYKPWHAGYYQGADSDDAPNQLDFETPFDPNGYAPTNPPDWHPVFPDELDDLQDSQNTPALTDPPGLNDPYAGEELKPFWDSMDEVLRKFSGTRGSYKVVTDFSLSVVDGFSGSYVNGDVRKISKCPTREGFTYVGHRHDEVHGLTPEWTWNSYKGTEHRQCALMRGITFANRSVKESYFGYNDPKPDEAHPKPDAPRSIADATVLEKFGVVKKDEIGPRAKATDWAVGLAPVWWMPEPQDGTDGYHVRSELNVGYGGGRHVRVVKDTCESYIHSATETFFDDGKTRGYVKRELITPEHTTSYISWGAIPFKTVRRDVGGFTETLDWGNKFNFFVGAKESVLLGGDLKLTTVAKIDFILGEMLKFIVGHKFDLTVGEKTEVTVGHHTKFNTASTTDLVKGTHVDLQGSAITLGKKKQWLMTQLML